MNRFSTAVIGTLMGLCLAAESARACPTPPEVISYDSFQCVLRGFYETGTPYDQIGPIPVNGYSGTPILGWYWAYDNDLVEIDQEDCTGYTTGYSMAWFSAEVVGTYVVETYAWNEAGWSQPAGSYINRASVTFFLLCHAKWACFRG